MSEPHPAPPTDTPSEDTPLQPLDVGSLLSAVQTARSSKSRGQRLYQFGTLAAAVSAGYFGMTAKVADPFHLYLGLIIFILAVVPSLMWAKRAQYGLPIFEAFMITGVNAYAIPLLRGQQMLKLYDVDTIQTAAVAVILFQVAAIATYFSINTKPRRGRIWRTEVVSRDISRVLGYGMAVTTAYTVVVQFTNLIPNDLASVIRAACYGLGIIATFVQCQRWGQGDLPYYDKGIFVAQLIAQVVFSWASLFLVQGVSILLLALLGYISGSKKIPILVIAVSMPVIAVLFNGKSMMRAKYWDAKAAAPTITEIPAFFSEWVNDGLQVSSDDSAAPNAGVLDRTSLIHMMCLVVSKTPSQKPFLMGLTYGQIPGQLVPRFFWKNKPLGHISTYTLSVYYGLQTEEETRGTTIGFGMLTEAYANFGYFGMGLVGFAIGLFFNKIGGWSSKSPIFSYPGLFTVVLMAWTFQTELPMSAWIASMLQACEAVLGIPFFLKNVL